MSSAPRLLYVVLFLQTQENGLWQDVRSFRRIQPHVFGILPLSPDSAPNFVPGGLVFIGQENPVSIHVVCFWCFAHCFL